VTVQLINDLHVLRAGLPRKQPGSLRKDMPLHRTYFHDIHEPQAIEAGLKVVCELVDDRGLPRAAPDQPSLPVPHRVHEGVPVLDGSGKVGRLIMNYFLMRAAT
jgi:hypothetical protein